MNSPWTTRRRAGLYVRASLQSVDRHLIQWQAKRADKMLRFRRLDWWQDVNLPAPIRILVDDLFRVLPPPPDWDPETTASPWMTSQEAALYLQTSVKTIERNRIQWQDQPVLGKLRFRSLDWNAPGSPPPIRILAEDVFRALQPPEGWSLEEELEPAPEPGVIPAGRRFDPQMP